MTTTKNVVTRPRSNVTTMYEPMVVLLNTGVVTRPRSNVTTIIFTVTAFLSDWL